MGIFDFFKKNKNIENDNGLNETYYDNGSGELKERFTKKNGEREGLYQYFNKNGENINSFEYKYGKKVGEYKNGEKEGEWVELIENNRGEGISLGKYEKPKIKTQSTYWGYSRVVNYQKGILNGECKIYLERMWDNSKKWGEDYKVLIEEGNYSDGVKHGIWKKHKITEKSVSQSSLNGGFNSGIIIEDIKLESKTIWKNGDIELPGIDVTDMINDPLDEKSEQEKLIDEMKLMTKNLEIKQGEDYKMEKWEYDNGQIKEIGCSLNSQKVGLWRLYYENGQLKVETFFNKEGNREGKYTKFYENGKIKEESKYKDDEIISQKYWNEDGDITEKEEKPSLSEMREKVLDSITLPEDLMKLSLKDKEEKFHSLKSNRDQLSDEDRLIFEKLREEIIQEKMKNEFGGD